MISSYALFGHIPKLSTTAAYCWRGRIQPDKMRMAVALAVLAGARLAMGSHASIPQSVEVPSNASTENLGGPYRSAVSAEGFVLRRSHTACSLLSGSKSPQRNWGSWSGSVPKEHHKLFSTHLGELISFFSDLQLLNPQLLPQASLNNPHPFRC